MANFTFTNSPTDLLVGGTGNDTFTLSDDTFLVSTDVARGQGGHDKIVVTNQISQLTSDAQFAGVRNIQELDYAKSVTGVQLLNMGADFAASGIKLIDASLVMVNTVQIDLAGVNATNLVINGGLADNQINGTDHNDLIRIRADTFSSTDQVNGGGHDHPGANADLPAREGDVLQLYQDKGPITLNDSAFFGTFVDTVALSGKAAFNVTLGADAQNNNIDIVDVSAAPGAVTVDVSARTDTTQILFSSAGLTAADKVTGTFGLTTLGIVDKAAVADAAFTNVKGVHTVEVVKNQAVADYTGAKITLGAKSQANGINRIENDSGHDLMVDAGLRTDTVVFLGGIANESVVGSQGQNFFFAGAGNDSLSLKVAAFGPDDTFSGGVGNDTLHIRDSDGKTAITDADFGDMTSVERLTFDAAGKQNVTLAATALGAGLTTIDASKITGGLTLDASSMHQDITVFAGSGADTITLGDFLGHVIMTSKQLTGADTLTGNGFGSLHFTDSVKLTDAYFSGLKTNVNGFDLLSLDNTGQGQSLTVGDNFANFIAHSTITRVNVATGGGFTFDFSKYNHLTGNTLTLTGGTGNDAFLLGSTNSFLSYSGGEGTDTFKISSANLAGGPNINGGGGFFDEVDVLDTGTAVTDADFANVTNVEVLKLLAGKVGTQYVVTLGANVSAHGPATIDASLAGVTTSIDASGMNGVGITMIASAKDNLLTGTDHPDTIVFAAATYNSNDLVVGGASGLVGDNLRFSTGGVVAASAFGGTGGIERLFLSDAGNAVTLSQFLVDGSEGLVNQAAPNGVDPTFQVNGGKGNDTVDLSQLTNPANQIQVTAGGGVDHFTGSIGDDVFIFAKDADLTSADVVKGGLGHDSVFVQLGTYGADIFNGLTSIEEVGFAAFAGTGTSTKLTLNNSAFKGADLNPDGTKDLTIHLYGGGNSTVDASAVTSPANRVTAILDNAASDTFIGGAGDDTIGFRDAKGFNLDATDSLDGGGGRDSLLLTLSKTGTALADAALAGVTSVERLEVDDQSGVQNTIAIGANAFAAGITEVDDIGTSGSMHLDATGYAGNLLVSANPNGFALNIGLGSGDDTVQAIGANLASSDTVNGGGGVNVFDLLGGGTIQDSAFTHVTNFSTLELGDGSYDVTLAAKGNQFTTIDASHANSGGATIKLDTGFTNSAVLIGSAGNDTVTSVQAANMTITGGAGNDVLSGGSGNDTYAYTAGTDSFMASKNDETHMDQIKNFQGHSGGAGDIIDLSGITGISGSVPQNLNTFATLGDIVDHINSSNSFAATSVVFGRTGTDTYLFVDTNHDGVLNFQSSTTAPDLVIKLVGTVTAFSLGEDSIVTS